MTLALVSSCSLHDTPVGPESFVIVDGNGNKYETDLIATFTGEVGSEVTLGLGVYDIFDIYGVDFGDGNIVVDTVCAENLGLKGDDGLTKPGTTHTSYTTFKGTVAGNGIIKVYGKSDVWYMNLSGSAMPTSLDQPKLMNVVQVSITGANVENIELPELPELKQFNFNNSPLKSIDVSQAKALTNLAINSTAVSEYEPQLAAIDVSQNTNLEYLSLQGNNKASGKLTKIDLSQNKNIKQVYLNYNQISEIILGENAITDFNASYNQLTAFDMSQLKAIKNIYLSGNQLTELDLSGITNKGTIQIQDNLFTLATLPAKPEITSTSKYTYAPQPAYQVPETITDENNLLDLSSQLTATGILAEPVTTTFTFMAGETELKEGEDYKVVEPGKFTFLKPQAEKVHAVMATEAFPKFTKNNAYVTTDFTVSVTAGGTVEAALFSWEDGTAANGTVTIPEESKNKIGNVIQVTSKKADIETDYVLITMTEALKEGDVLNMTGYRNKDNDANGNLYILFETGAVIDEGNEVKWNNIHESVGQEPNTNSYTVTAEAAGSKTIKLARSKASTNVYIQKMEVVRK